MSCKFQLSFFSVSHVSLSVVTHLSIFYFKLYWISVFSTLRNTLWKYSSVAVPRRLFIGPNSSNTSNLASSNEQLSSIDDICQLIKNQGKPLKIICLFLIDYWCCSHCPQLWASVLTKRLRVLNKFIFSRHISLATAIKHLINPPSVNGFLCLAKKWATWQLTLAALFSFIIFVKKFCCDKIFHFKCSNFSDHCFPVSWEYCNECLVW